MFSILRSYRRVFNFLTILFYRNYLIHFYMYYLKQCTFIIEIPGILNKVLINFSE